MQSVLTEDFEILSQSNLAFEQFRDKKILITGATGLIGSLLVKTFLYCNHVHQLNMKVHWFVTQKRPIRYLRVVLAFLI